MGAGHTRYIELKLRDMSQLFNSMDPSPFNEKDLDHDAEEFIVSWAQEYPAGDPIVLRVHLEQSQEAGCQETIREAVHHYFSYRSQIARMEFHHLLRQARTTLLVGLIFLAGCIISSQMISARINNTWSGFFSEGLTIVGWVAMWRPIQLYLYDWWPMSRQIRVYLKLSQMPVEVINKSK